ncbi:MAG: hypothetical protein HUU60_02895 [Armatimonadetes bacterium]|nr:hypothetical protein [Armatimonadota bacterium]
MGNLIKLVLTIIVAFIAVKLALSLLGIVLSLAKSLITLGIIAFAAVVVYRLVTGGPKALNGGTRRLLDD